VSVFDWTSEEGLTNRRVFADLRPEELRPDGLTIDAEGGVWIGLSNGGAVRRYDATGVLSEIVEVPATKATACTFGGENLDELYITTSRENLEDDEQPAAGSLFLAHPGVRGLPTREYGG
jgi:sugar lactone lactonase YvrE